MENWSRVKKRAQQACRGFNHLALSEIFQVFVVSDDCKWVLSSLQTVPPFLQQQFHGEQLPISNIVVLLRWGKLTGEVNTSLDIGEALRGIKTALFPRQWWRHPLPLWMGVGVLNVRGWLLSTHTFSPGLISCIFIWNTLFFFVVVHFFQGTSVITFHVLSFINSGWWTVKPKGSSLNK